MGFLTLTASMIMYKTLFEKCMETAMNTPMGVTPQVVLTERPSSGFDTHFSQINFSWWFHRKGLEWKYFSFSTPRTLVVKMKITMLCHYARVCLPLPSLFYGKLNGNISTRKWKNLIQGFFLAHYPSSSIDSKGCWAFINGYLSREKTI